VFIGDGLRGGSWPGDDVAGLYDDGGIAYGPSERVHQVGPLFEPLVCPVPVYYLEQLPPNLKD